jgi:hypothetical protein
MRSDARRESQRRYVERNREKIILKRREKYASVRAERGIKDRPTPAILLLLKNRRISPSGCWEWTAVPDSSGYGTMTVFRKKDRAHRVSYEIFIGKIPADLEIDHLCRNRKCFNPLHLQAVSSRVNCLRGESIASKNANKTECVHGHEFSAQNTYIRIDGGGRMCRECSRIRSRKRYKRRTK